MKISVQQFTHRTTILWKNPKLFFKKFKTRIRPMRKDYRKRFQMNLKEWILYHQKNIVFEKCTWMGVRALKNPLDAWIYQEIIFETKPDIIIEIGSKEGGSTLYFAQLLELMKHGNIISIDIDRTNYHINHERITAITGNSSSTEVVEQVKSLCKSANSILVMHDGAHDKEQVLRDIHTYESLVTIGSYFIIEDGIVDLFKPHEGVGNFEAGPLAAVTQFLSEQNNFIVDLSRERYLITYNPHGFLKRIK